MSARLDAVTKAKTAYVTTKTTLEARLRKQLQAELANMQAQVDLAVRLAFNSGETKADIMRALGTKDFHTIANSLARTEGVTEIVGEDPLDKVYSFADGVLSVNYVNHGSGNVTAQATFDVQKLADGSVMLSAHEPLWNETYTVKNDAVALLSGRFDGEYYEEAIEWLMNTNAL